MRVKPVVLVSLLVLGVILGGCGGSKPLTAFINRPEDGKKLASKAVEFRGRGTNTEGKDLTFHWDFGDNEKTTEQNISHTYAKGGNYTTALTASDGKMEASETINIHISEISVKTQPECTITLQPGKSIQAAVNSVPKKGIICLEKGSWQENIKVKKSLTLRGKGREETIVQGDDTGYPVVQIQSDQAISVNVEDLTVKDAKGGPKECVALYPSSPRTICPDGIAIQDRAQVVLRNLAVTNNGHMGVYSTDHTRVEIYDSQISHNGRIGLFVRRYAKGDVKNANIVNNNEGAMVAGNASLSMNSTDIKRNNSYGLFVGGQPIANLKHCQILRNGQNGIALGGGWSPQLVLTTTEIAFNRGWGILKLNYPNPFSGGIKIDEKSSIHDNEKGRIGSK